MKNQFSFVLTGKSVILVKNGHTVTVTNTHRKYADIRQACLSGNLKRAYDLVDILPQLKNQKVTVKDGAVYYGDYPLENPACDVLLDMIDEAAVARVRVDTSPLVNFLDRLMKNPEQRAVACLWKFMEASKMTLFPDGRFLAYKKVSRLANGKLVDSYTGKFNNDPGQTVSVPRSAVDDDPNVTCSRGLHVCSEAYLPEYGHGDSHTTVIVAVDPADVVAVPTDYNNAKMRVCKYEVLFVRDGDPHSPVREFTNHLCGHSPSTSVCPPVKRKEIVTPQEAMDILGLDQLARPKDALRKRLQRGVTCRRCSDGMIELL
jgi:hypothetical protein